MPVNHQSIISGSMSSSASIEIQKSVEDNLDYYIERDYSFIPLPFNEKYYDVDQREIKELNPEQLIKVDATVRQTIEHLLDHPFVLIYFPKHVFELNGELTLGSNISLEKDPIHHGNLHEVSQSNPDLRRSLYELTKDAEVFRIITLADVNRRVVKEALFSVVAEFETRLADTIRNSEIEEDDIFSDLKAETIGRWIKNKQEDVNVDISQYMNLGEMVKITAKYPELRENFGYESRNQFDKALGGLVGKRHRIMHASRNLVSNRDELESLIKYISNAEAAIEENGGTIQGGYADPESPVQFT